MIEVVLAKVLKIIVAFGHFKRVSVSISAVDKKYVPFVNWLANDLNPNLLAHNLIIRGGFVHLSQIERDLHDLDDPDINE